MKSRHARKSRKVSRKTRRRQRGGGTMKVSEAVKKLQDIQTTYGDLEFFRLDLGKYMEPIRRIYFSDEGTEKKVLLE